VRFALVAVIVREINSETYSQWVFWLSISTYVALADIGVIPFLQYRLMNMSKKKAPLSRRIYWRLANSLFLFMHGLIVLVFGIFYIADLAPVFFGILLLTTAFQNFGRLGQVFARLRKRYHETVMFQTVANLVFLGFCYLKIDEASTLHNISVFYLLCYGLSAIASWIVGRNTIVVGEVSIRKGLRYLCFLARSYSRTKKLIARSYWFTVNFSVSILLNSIPIFILTVYYNAASLVAFVAVRMVYNFIFMSSNIVFISVIPEGFATMANLAVMAKKKILARLCMHTTLYAIIVGTVITLLLDVIILHWTGGNIEVELMLAISIFFLAIIQCLVNLVINVAGALGAARPISIVNILAIAFAVLISFAAQNAVTEIALAEFLFFCISFPLFIGFSASYLLVKRKMSSMPRST